jgi:hypothetical protein
VRYDVPTVRVASESVTPEVRSTSISLPPCTSACPPPNVVVTPELTSTPFTYARVPAMFTTSLPNLSAAPTLRLTDGLDDAGQWYTCATSSPICTSGNTPRPIKSQWWPENVVM